MHFGSTGAMSGSWQLRRTGIGHFGSPEPGLARASSGEPESRIFGSPELGLARASSGKPESCIFGSPESDLARGSY